MSRASPFALFKILIVRPELSLMRGKSQASNMTGTTVKIDYSETLYLPQTEFAMRWPAKEPAIDKRWQDMGMVQAAARGRQGNAKSTCCADGPPYANGNIHIGHALNKVLKDIVITRSFQMRGYDIELRAGLGLPRPADRMEDRGRELSLEGQVEARPFRRCDDRGFRRECRCSGRLLDQGAGRRVQATRRRRRRQKLR